MPLARPDLQELRERPTIMWTNLRAQIAGVGPVDLMDAAVEHVVAGRSLRQLRTMV